MWVVLGVIIGVIFLATIWSIGNGLTTVGRVRESAQAYADEALPAILDGWNADELISRSAVELKKNVPAEQTRRIMAELKDRLGAFKSVEKARMGDFVMPADSTTGPYMVAPFVADATFEKGKAVVEIKLVRQEGKWKIGNFFVREPTASTSR